VRRPELVDQALARENRMENFRAGVFGALRIGLVELITLSRSQLSRGRVFGWVAVGRDEFWSGHRRFRST
jgi:hypothetical protein